MSRSPSGISPSSSSSSSSLQALREEGAAAVDADDRERAIARVALDDLVSDARQRSLNVLLAEDDLLAACVHLYLPGLTGPG